MASEIQSNFIADLVVKKTKEFKEVKELLLSSDIVSDNAETVKQAETIAAINNALTDLQASKFIDLLTSMKDPARGTSYSQKRINQVTDILEDIKKDIDAWDFPDAHTPLNYGKAANALYPKVAAGIKLLNNPEIEPETRQRNQEIFLREIAKAIYDKTYDMNAFDMEIEHTTGSGIDDRYYGMAKVASNSVSQGAV